MKSSDTFIEKLCAFWIAVHVERERVANPFLGQTLGNLLCIAVRTTALSNSSNTGFQTKQCSFVNCLD